MARVGFAGVTKIDDKPVTLPVPDRVSTCGLPETLSAMDIVPVWVPKAVGVKVMEIAQLAPPASVFGENGHIEVWEKAPEATIPKIVSGLAWLFFKVRTFTALAMPNN